MAAQNISPYILYSETLNWKSSIFLDIMPYITLKINVSEEHIASIFMVEE
jgi:hypothetical protein